MSEEIITTTIEQSTSVYSSVKTIETEMSVNKSYYEKMTKEVESANEELSNQKIAAVELQETIKQ
jgi:hypothetical protein